MIHYVNDDLFNAPLSQLLVHACNCQGVWGSGIAKQFAERYPDEYHLYRSFLDVAPGPGNALVINRVGCLFTSLNYGKDVDPTSLILQNTYFAMETLLTLTTMDLAMPKINSGLLRVPWEHTEAVLKQFNRDIYVYDPITK